MISRLATIAEKFIRVFTVRSVRLGRILERRQRVIQIAAAAVAIGLGLWGWTINKPPANLSNWFDNIFRTAQLVTLQFPADLYDSIPWQLQVARLLVPLVAILATINVLVGAITRPIRLALIRAPRPTDPRASIEGGPRTRDARAVHLPVRSGVFSSA